MSDRDRLHGLIDVLPDETIAAILTLVDPPSRVLTNEEFAAVLASAPIDDEMYDHETVARILTEEKGPGITLED